MSRESLRHPTKSMADDREGSYRELLASRVRPPEPIQAGAHRRGRPTQMPPAALLERIQKLAARREGLFRIHRTHRDLYARARRQFGSWAAAVQAAGLDYEIAMRRARARSIENRRKHPSSRRSR